MIYYILNKNLVKSGVKKWCKSGVKTFKEIIIYSTRQNLPICIFVLFKHMVSCFNIPLTKKINRDTESFSKCNLSRSGLYIECFYIYQCLLIHSGISSKYGNCTWSTSLFPVFTLAFQQETNIPCMHCVWCHFLLFF